MRSNYPELHVFKTAEPKLRKAIISDCNQELLNSISECVLNVFKLNKKLSTCDTRKLRKHKAALRKDVERRILLLYKKKLIVKRVG